MKGDKRPPRALPPGMAKKILSKATTPRDRAMVVLMWRAGLRQFEACALNIEDLEPTPSGGLRAHIKEGKGGKAGWAEYDKKSAQIVTSAFSGRTSGPVMVTSTGKALHTSQIRRRFGQLKRAAHCNLDIGAHSLRHTFAVELYREGLTVLDIQHALRHERLETTAAYLTAIGCYEVLAKTGCRDW